MGERQRVGGPVPADQVSAQIHISTATMTSVLDTLERNTYIRRQPDPAGRRRVLVDITPRAQALLDQVLPAVQEIVTVTMSRLGDRTLHTLPDALTAASGALDAARPATPPLAAPRPSCGAPDTSHVPQRLEQAGAAGPLTAPRQIDRIGIRRLACIR